MSCDPTLNERLEILCGDSSVSAEQRRKAAKRVLAASQTAEEAATLLSMLGLTHEDLTGDLRAENE